MNKEKIPNFIRNIVWATYIGNNSEPKCFICNLEPLTKNNFECGHIESEKNGGRVTIDNLRPVCSPCNKSVGSKNMEQVMQQYGLIKNKYWNGFFVNTQESENQQTNTNIINNANACTQINTNIINNANVCTQINTKAINVKLDNPTLSDLDRTYFSSLIKYTKKDKFVYTPKQKKYFEQYVCAITKPSRFYIECTAEGKIIMSPKDLSNAFPEYQDFIRYWLKDLAIKYYNRIDFRPDIKNCPPTTLNLFQGFNVINNYVEYDKNKRDEIIKPLLDHFKMLCGDNIMLFTYYMKLYANMFQNPEKKAEIALIMRGKQGCGKTFTNTEIWGRMLGNNLYISSNKQNTFFDKHAASHTKMLINLDDIQGKNITSVIKLLEAWITNTKTCINIKNIPAIEINLFACFVFTTKSTQPIQITRDDRRFIIIDVSDKKMNDTVYFNNLSNLIKNSWTVLSAFYDYLMAIKIEDDYAWVNNRPVVDIQSISPDINFLIKCPNNLKQSEVIRAGASDLDMPNNIFCWINDYFCKTTNTNDYIKLKDMFKRFTLNKCYSNLSKTNKRTYNYNYFVEQVSENILFSKYYRARAKINGIVVTNIITNYKDPINEIQK